MDIEELIENLKVKGEVHQKGWGFEIWIANSPLYCTKALILNGEGKKSSIHYHIRKDEVLWVLYGAVLMETYPDAGIRPASQIPCKNKIGRSENHFMTSRDGLHIPPLLPHRFYGMVKSIIIEGSTQHFEEDSYRIEKGD